MLPPELLHSPLQLYVAIARPGAVTHGFWSVVRHTFHGMAGIHLLCNDMESASFLTLFFSGTGVPLQGTLAILNFEVFVTVTKLQLPNPIS